MSLMAGANGGRLAVLIGTFGDKGWRTDPFEVNADGNIDFERYVAPQLAYLVKKMAEDA